MSDSNKSAIQYTERELIQRAIRAARPENGSRHLERWVLVKQIFCTGSQVSRAICSKYGFDPDQEIAPLARISDELWEENLLEHGVVR